MALSSLPLVSIVTVCRNAQTTIEATLRSVLHLHYPALEQIVIDGLSTDGTLEAIERLASSFGERGIALRVVSEKDAGIYDAMNKGAALAQGEWVCYMNAGDSFAQPEVLQQLLGQPLGENCGVVYGQVALRKSFGDVVMRPKPIDYLRKKMAFCHQASLVRTALLQAQPFDLRYRLAADYAWFRRYWKSGGGFQYREVVVAIFEAEGGASSSQRLRVNREYAQIRGIDPTWAWRLRYAWKWCTVQLKGLWRNCIPKSWSEQLRAANYKRLQARR